MKTQSLIDLQIDAVRILLAIRAFSSGAESDDFDSYTIWTVRTFCGLFGWSLERTDQAVRWLERSHYMVMANGQCLVTDAGLEFSRGAVTRREFQVSISRWKAEVLTGITDQGDRSKIDRAVLPKAGRAAPFPKTPEDIMSRHELELQARVRQARRLNLTIEEFDAGVRDGKIKICPGTGAGEHVGVFHRDGNGWQRRCVQCRKTQRRKNK